MARHWTPEERQRQAQLIRQWQPWSKSTGPRTNEGKAASSKNAFVHGGRSAEWLESMKSVRTLLREQRKMLQSMR